MSRRIAKPIVAAITAAAFFPCIAPGVVHAQDATATVAPTAIAKPDAVTIQAAIVVMRQPNAALWRGIALLGRARRVAELMNQATSSVDIVVAAQAIRESAVILGDNADLQSKLAALVGITPESEASGELGKFQKATIANPKTHPQWPAGLQLPSSDQAEFDKQLKGNVKDVRDKINNVLGNGTGGLGGSQQKFSQRANEVAYKVQLSLAAVKASDWNTAFPAADSGSDKTKKLLLALDTFNKALPQLAKVQAAYNALVTAQSLAKGASWAQSGTEQNAFEGKMKALGAGDLSVRAAVERVPDGLTYITDALPTAVTKVVQLVQKAGPEPPTNVAVAQFQTVSEQLKTLHTVAANVGQLHTALKASGNAYDAIIKKDNEQLEKQRVSRQIMADAVATLDEGLAGDMGQFEVRQARLFYFTNAVQLLKALNPKARLLDAEALDAREASRSSHRLVLANEQALNEALGEVNDLRVVAERLRTAIEQARQAAQ